MSVLVIDTECSGALRNKANPFDRRNKLVAIGYFNGTNVTIHYLRNSDASEILPTDFYNQCKQANIIVGFNLKFDLHWLRRYGLDLRGKKLWDCQLAEFILSNQKDAYPSLDASLQARGLPLKLNTLSQYLDSNVDVDCIPEEELLGYLKGDLTSTYQLYVTQKSLIKPYESLFRLQCSDLEVLADMEYNGMKYNLAKSKELSDASDAREAVLLSNLNNLCNCNYINWGSNDHVSAVLYGGRIVIEKRVPVGVYRTGNKAGSPRFKIEEVEYPFPRLVDPLKGSALKKEGFFSVGEDVLSELKATGTARKIITNLQQLAKIRKERNTYFDGIPKKMAELECTEYVHGQINQCVVVTGRTSSSKPNLQNIPEGGRECFESRFS
jgi:DNA polymerase-1